MLLCALLRLPLENEKLYALFSSVKNCGLTPEEQVEYLQLWLTELDDDDRAAVQKLIDSDKTVLEAINSFRGRRNGKQTIAVQEYTACSSA
jgi:hypothetical protein